VTGGRPVRWIGALLLLPLAACSAATSPDVPVATAHPLRVMSLNDCTDQLVLALLPPSRIASVTWLARDPQISLMTDAAERVAINHGSVEEVARARPDLVIIGRGTMPETRALLDRLGWPTLVVDDAEDFSAIRRVTRQVAAALDERARGEALIADMDRNLAALAAHPGPAVRVAAWDDTGLGAQPGSLYNAVLHAIGVDNVAEQPGLATAPTVDSERLLATAPQLLLQSDAAGAGGRPARGSALIRRFWSRNRIVDVPSADFICGTPMVGRAALALQRRLRAAAAKIGAPLSFSAVVR
jgi:iron complex transport system substrate-binding protein